MKKIEGEILKDSKIRNRELNWQILNIQAGFESKFMAVNEELRSQRAMIKELLDAVKK